MAEPVAPPEAASAAALPAGEGLAVFDAGGTRLYLTVDATGTVTGYNGHVDLGTGIRTALAQVVAEELDVPLPQVRVVLGNTAVGPDQGATIASMTIQAAAVPLRQAAATARRHLLAAAASHFNTPAEALVIADGTIRMPDASGVALGFGELVAGERIALRLDPDAPQKPVADYAVVGRSPLRVDIPAKATGALTFVHDVRVPGMLHGRVVRPPYAGFDSGPHVGQSLVSVDRDSVADVPGLVAVVAIGDFVGVVTEREESADRAMRKLRCVWRPAPRIPDLNAPEAALRANPSRPRRLADRGDVDRAIAAAALPMQRTYVWPYQMHGSIGPSCAVADCRGDGATVWSGTQNPFSLRADLARLLDLAPEQVVIERYEAAGCYGRNGADDVSADAALLSRAVGRPVRVQLTREQELAWEPKGAAQVMDVRGGLDLGGGAAGYDFETRYPSNDAPTLALLLTGKVPATATPSDMGDRTAIPPYAYGNLRVTVHDMPPIARASWFRGVSALPNSFAHESFVDEPATAARVDPIEYRLRYLTDPRPVELVKAVAARAGWLPHTAPGSLGGRGDMLYGRGFAYACYLHGKFPGVAAAWAAWVADVAVNKATGEVAVTRVVAGQDAGLMINPDGVRHQIHGNVIQSVSRVLHEEVQFSDTAVISQEWGAYTMLGFPELPEIDVLMLARPDEPPLGVGESASVPSAAAIANALFDATGVRFRELPLTPEKVRAALGIPALAPATRPPMAPKRRRWRLPAFGVLAGAALSLLTVILGQPAISKVDRPAADVFSPATVERGRIAAAIGACNVCHVGVDGTDFAGGRPLETPFGTIYAANITPDAEAGIGAWSYPAFERAMRRGVSRDGHQLYPAHPYTAFANASEADLEAVYAYMMTQPVAPTPAPQTALPFPWNLRLLMAGWNAFFLRSGTTLPDASQTAAWNRGKELVEGLGHCGACHTERNMLGAESAATPLAGGVAEGWDAPALTAASRAPLPWTEQAIYDYLRTGWSAEHGPAAGPMADVVRSLRPVPDADITAMATYLASLAGTAPSGAAVQPTDAAVTATMISPVGARLFAGACASCHEANTALTALGLNTNLYAARPDNVLRAILDGVVAPAESPGQTAARADAVESMPGFGAALSDSQLAGLLTYLRARFAPTQPAWPDLAGAVVRARAHVHVGALH